MVMVRSLDTTFASISSHPWPRLPAKIAPEESRFDLGVVKIIDAHVWERLIPEDLPGNLDFIMIHCILNYYFPEGPGLIGVNSPRFAFRERTRMCTLYC